MLQYHIHLLYCTKSTGTLAHCYYIARLTLDTATTEYIQFKATEVLLTIHKTKHDIFFFVQDELFQYFESVTTVNQEISEKLQEIKKYFNSKHISTNQIVDKTEFNLNMSNSKQGGKEPSKELLESSPHDLLILDIVADHLTCPFTQEVTNSYSDLPIFSANLGT